MRPEENAVAMNDEPSARCKPSGPSGAKPASPWLTVKQAASRAQVGPKLIYREVHAGRLKAAKVGGRRELRLRPEWVDEWLDQASVMVMVGADAR